MSDPGNAPTSTAPTSHIGAVAERTGLSLRTLRHYDEIGLVPPSARSEGGFRLYTDADVERILLVRRMKPLGFSLDEMADLLEITDRLLPPDRDATAVRGEPGAQVDENLRARLDAYVVAAEERRADLARKLDWADELIALLRSR
ncbi:MerR family transcriptional regulator [Cellulosimicrobium arenosum]|uniref:MerR family transcriptional regulator n=1 Tax=Cellulosimicrobium arenosum TaxID=2708133 RepID=A0A927PE56_9MICO|nr:MerR family transcriptional regulator [Cellulosimicrobium arenosum]MBD8079876.1 MerR family transcriptional regulator [Cellulosimicrobium arenosum]